MREWVYFLVGNLEEAKAKVEEAKGQLKYSKRDCDKPLVQLTDRRLKAISTELSKLCLRFKSI